MLLKKLRFWKGLEKFLVDLEGFGMDFRFRHMWKFLWLWNGYLIWERFGRVFWWFGYFFSFDLEVWLFFSFDLEGFGDLEGIWKGLERFLGICRGFCASGRVGGALWTLGLVICLKKVLQCHSLEITGYHATGQTVCEVWECNYSIGAPGFSTTVQRNTDCQIANLLCHIMLPASSKH